MKWEDYKTQVKEQSKEDVLKVVDEKTGKIALSRKDAMDVIANA